jgi:hypothetical protein
MLKDYYYTLKLDYEYIFQISMISMKFILNIFQIFKKEA